MKNIYTNTYIINTIFSTLVILLSTMPSVSDAASFMPTSRTYYPAGNTQAINIVNNNYNNNVNTNNNQNTQAAVPTYVNYVAPVAYEYAGADVSNIAQGNLPKNKVYSKKVVKRHVKRTKTTTCTNCIQPTYKLVRQSGCGASVAIANVKVAKPTCTLVPSIKASGAIELQWTTNGATVAYLNNGIGHVNTVNGKRVITPSKDTAYNLTVLNDAGIAGSCGARVNVSMGQAGTLAVTATNTNYTYSLNTNGQRPPLAISNSEAADESNSTSTSIETKVTDIKEGSILSKIFGDGFKKVAMPVGIVFLILIVLLVIIMSKVKAAK